MLPRPLRLSSSRDFSRVFSSRGTISHPLFNIRLRRTTLPHARIGIVISNKISKKAVVRNLIKRRIRAILNTHRSDLPEGMDIVIICKPSIIDVSQHDIQIHLLSLIRSISSRN